MEKTRYLFKKIRDTKGTLLEKEMATHSSILVWKIPWTEDPGGLQSMGLQGWTQLTHTHEKKRGRAWLKKIEER